MLRKDAAGREEESANNCLEAVGDSGCPQTIFRKHENLFDEGERAAQGPPMRAPVYVIGRK